MNSANNGAGPGDIRVEQRVPVIGGHLYNFRFNYRSDSLKPDKRAAGPDRGYADLEILVEWQNTNTPAKSLYIFSMAEMSNTPDWKQLTNSLAQPQAVPLPYQAPDWATRAVVHIRMTTAAANVQPTAYVDDIEL